MKNETNKTNGMAIPYLKFALKIVAWVAIAILVVGGATMLLWNALMPEIFHLQQISFVQALGLALLGRLLVGGWMRMGGGGGWRGRGGHWKHNWRKRWEGLTPEQRAHYQNMYMQRCQPRGRYSATEREDEQPQTPSAAQL